MKKNIFTFLIVWFFILFLAQLFSYLMPPKFYINFTSSEPIGVYKLIPGYEDLKIGDYVLFEVPDHARPYIHGRGWLPEGWVLLKNVGALPGDMVTITDSEVRINNTVIGPVLLADNKNRPLPQLRGDFEIPEGFFFPISKRLNNSFDGRYFGPISHKLIIGKAVPILTFE